MATSWLVVYRALLLIAAVFGLILLLQVRTHLEKPGVKPLILLIAGSLVYIAVKLTVSVVRGTPPVYLVTRLNPLGAGLATLGFFLLVVEYTEIEQPVSRRTTALLLIEPILVSSLVWIDLELLWVPVGEDPSTLSGYAWELTSLAIANQLYMNILLILGAGFLVWFAIRSNAVFKRQVVALILAVTGPIVGNILFYAGYIPFNLTPVMFVFSGFLLAGAIFWTNLFDLVPLGRKAVVNNLDACVLTIDRDHRLIDTNESTRRLFDFTVTDDIVGRDIDDVFSKHPDFREFYSSITDGSATASSPVELADRYYNVEVVELGNAGEAILGCTIIMCDVTDQTLRRQELERKNDQLERFAKVLSHDLRNPLNVASARLQLARDEPDAEHFEAISEAHNRMETLIDDVLTVTKEGETVSNFEPIDLADFIETCREYQAEVEVAFELDEGVGE